MEAQICISANRKRTFSAPWNTAWSSSAANGAPASSACSPRWTCRITANCARRWATSPTQFSLQRWNSSSPTASSCANPTTKFPRAWTTLFPEKAIPRIINRHFVLPSVNSFLEAYKFFINIVIFSYGGKNSNRLHIFLIWVPATSFPCKIHIPSSLIQPFQIEQLSKCLQ